VTARAAASPAERIVIWHDVECGSYGADLPLWCELAGERGGPIVDLGCGTGRVALNLARAGHEVLGIDVEPALVAELERRASDRGLPVRARLGDMTSAEMRPEHPLVLATMQVIHLLAGPAERSRALATIRSALAPGGLAALAIVEGDPTHPGDEDGPPPLPDVAEHDGWVYASLPLATEVTSGAIVVRRLRQAVSPAGDLDEEQHELRLAVLTASLLEAEAAGCGLRCAGRRSVEATDHHIGSTVVLLEASS
jgi:SAM-dependent methyltransferase